MIEIKISEKDLKELFKENSQRNKLELKSDKDRLFFESKSS